MAKVRLGGWVELSAVDWPGNLTFMLFFAGCNLTCPFCQNGRLISLDSGSPYDLEEVEAKILGSLKLIDALGFGGGEPTLQPEALKLLSQWARGWCLRVLLETNGTRPKVIKEMLESGLLSYVALDVKAPLTGAKYGTATGKPAYAQAAVRAVRETLGLCAASQVPYEVRTTVVPGLTDAPEDVAAIAEDLAGFDPVYVLQQFTPSEGVLSADLRTAAPTSREALFKLARVAGERGISRAFIRTREHGLEGASLR